MAESREREIEAQRLAAEQLKAEEPPRDLCCQVNPQFTCKCSARFCMDHYRERVKYFKGKRCCERCMKFELLFGEV